MPRPRRPGAPEPKRRSRNGCWPCKTRKVKCDEEKPSCLNCRRQSTKCDYSIKLNWEGRTKRRASIEPPSPMSSESSPHIISFSLSPPAHQQLASRGTENASPEAAGNILPWDTGLSHAPTPESGQNRNINGVQKSLDVRSLDQIAFENKESSLEISNLLQMQDTIFPWSEQPSHFTTTTSEEATLQETLSLLHSIEDEPYPSPAETDCNRLLHRPSASDGPLNKSPRDMLFPNAQRNGPISHTSSPASSGNVYTPGIPIDFLLDKPGDHNEGSGQQLGLSTSEKRWHAYLNSVTDNYGLDCGRPDLDLNKNDDHGAIDVNHALNLVSPQWKSQRNVSMEQQTKFSLESYSQSIRNTYYASPVSVDIPRYLSPLPMALLKNPINLMYFHHFINHTARMLVPHDCEDNPFVSVLPSMAITDSNLLNLALAYSASHRARYLGHAEPANRIADWVSDVFPALRLALDDPHESITDSHVATAIMLLSLKIISPSTFEVPISWQSHLNFARDLFHAHANSMLYPGNRIGAFLARWLGYIDIMGTLSCRNSDPPLGAYYSIISACSTPGEHDELFVDCFAGFSSRTGEALIRLGRLVYQCDNERFDDMGTFRPDWRASADAILEADALLAEFEALRTQVHVHKRHYRGSSGTDMIGMDQAFCCSALLHIHRRVLDSSPLSTAVQGALNGLTQAMAQVEPGGSAEVGALFPLVTAGCEAQDTQQRIEILERFMILEKTGMKQIQSACQLMRRCWERDLPWIALAEGEFLG